MNSDILQRTVTYSVHPGLGGRYISNERNAPVRSKYDFHIITCCVCCRKTHSNNSCLQERHALALQSRAVEHDASDVPLVQGEPRS